MCLQYQSVETFSLKLDGSFNLLLSLLEAKTRMSWRGDIFQSRPLSVPNCLMWLSLCIMMTDKTFT